MNNLRQARKANNMTQIKLATLVHVPQTTLSCWERGIGEPTIGVALKLCKTLNKKLEEVFPNANDE